MSQFYVQGSGGGGSGDVETLTGNTGGAVPPTANNINIIGSGGTTVTGNPGTNTLTISSNASVLIWNNVTGTSASAAVNNGYLANNAGLVTITLPAIAAQFSVVAVAGGNSGAGGWKIAQNSGQQINFGSATTTSGTGGSLASTKQYDCVYLLCTTANTNFVVLNSVGNLTVV